MKKSNETTVSLDKLFEDAISNQGAFGDVRATEEDGNRLIRASLKSCILKDGQIAITVHNFIDSDGDLVIRLVGQFGHGIRCASNLEIAKTALRLAGALDGRILESDGAGLLYWHDRRFPKGCLAESGGLVEALPIPSWVERAMVEIHLAEVFLLQSALAGGGMPGHDEQIEDLKHSLVSIQQAFIALRGGEDAPEESERSEEIEEEPEAIMV